MPEQAAAEDLIVRNLIEALERLREDLDRMELWAAVLGSFQHPVPEYRPGDRHLIKPQAAPGTLSWVADFRASLPTSADLRAKPLRAAVFSGPKRGRFRRRRKP